MMSLSSESSLEKMTVLPEIKLDSSAEDWEEFVVSWARHKEKFNLASPDLIRQLIACLEFIDSLSSDHGLEPDVICDRGQSNPKETVSVSTPQSKVSSEISVTKVHTQSQVKRKRSRKKSKKKTHTVQEEDKTRFMTETKSYQPGDFQFNSLSFGEIAALMYSARKVTRELQSVNKVKIPHMLRENMKWVVRGAESQPVIRLAVQVSTKSYTTNNIKPPSTIQT